MCVGHETRNWVMRSEEETLKELDDRDSDGIYARRNQKRRKKLEITRAPMESSGRGE